VTKAASTVRTGAAVAGCLSLLLVLASCGTGGDSASPDATSGQADLLASVRNDREHLFAGSLSYATSVTVSVDDTVTYDVRLTARAENASHGTTQRVAATRTFRVGGVEGAALTSASQDVRVVLRGDQQREQVIARPGELAAWGWSISASEPGDYDLGLTVTTYQGRSHIALDTLAPPLTVHLRVRDTWSHRWNSTLDSVGTWGGIGAALTTITAVVVACRDRLTALLRARRESWRARGQQRDAGVDEERQGYL
jgi:hypothetical protein